MELFNILQSFLFIFWYFYSGNLIRQNKVTVVNKLIKVFSGISLGYVFLIILEAVFGTKYMLEMYAHEEIVFMIIDDGKEPETFEEVSIVSLNIVFTIYVIGIIIITFFYLQILRSHRQAMV